MSLCVPPGAFVDPAKPLEEGHPLNRGIVADWTILPNSGWSRGGTLRDLARGLRPVHDGTLTNGAAWGGPPSRPAGNGVVTLDGTDDWVALQSGSFDYTGDKSFFCWVYLTSLTTNRAIFGRDQQNIDGNNVGYLFRTAATTGKLVYTKRAIADVNAVTSAITANKWQYVGFSKTSSGVTFFVNGVGETISDSNSEIGGETPPVRIGQSRRDDIPFIGSITGPTFYNRALSTSQAAALYSETGLGNPERFRWVSTRFWSIPATGVTVPLFYRQRQMQGMAA